MKFLMIEFQFVMSKKNWRSIVCIVCHSPIPVKSSLCYHMEALNHKLLYSVPQQNEIP